MTSEMQKLLEAAKSAVELSGWRQCKCGESHHQVSAIAMANLAMKVEAAENPQLPCHEVMEGVEFQGGMIQRLAPEPIPQGL